MAIVRAWYEKTGYMEIVRVEWTAHRYDVVRVVAGVVERALVEINVLLSHDQ